MKDNNSNKNANFKEHTFPFKKGDIVSVGMTL